MYQLSGLDYMIDPRLFGVPGAFSRKGEVERERLIQNNLAINISNLAINRFKWEGLPDSIDERFLETTLLLNGLAVFYWDDDFDKLLAVKASSQGYVNFQGLPTSFTIIGPGSKIQGIDGQSTFISKQIGAYIPSAHADKSEREKRRKGIPMWPNYMRYPEIDTIMIYSTRLATTDRTLEINTENARLVKILSSTPNTQLSMVNINRQLQEGLKTIEVKAGNAMTLEESIKVLDLGIDPDSYEKLHVLRTRWWNECMGLLGIDNANQDKKERLVAAEVGANDSQTDSMRFVSLNARRQAAEQINEVFGLNVSVDFNVEVERQAEQLRQLQGISSSDNANDDGEVE